MGLSVCWKSELLPTARRFSGRIAVKDADGSASFERLFAGAAGVSATLAQRSVAPGQPVATLFRNSRRAVEAAYAVMLAGGCEVAINAHLSPDDARHCLAASKARILLTDRQSSMDFGDFDGEMLILDDMVPQDFASLTPVPVPAETWARIVFTSGTTGKPKGIVHSHLGRWTGNLLLRASLPQAPHGRDVLLLTPFSHGASLLTFAFLDGGGSATLFDGLDVDAVIGRLESGSSTQFFASPTILAKLLPALEGRRIGSVETIFCGTAPLSPELYRAARAVFGPVVRITYGKTEIFNPITVLRPDETDRFYGESPVETTCVGWPAGGVEIRIAADEADLEGEPAVAGVPGPVLLRARHMLAGTLSEGGYDPHPDGAFHRTGDVGFLDPEGRLHLLGRESDVMKSGGYRIAPEEVEAKLRPHMPTGAEIAVFGCPSAYWGEVVTLAVVDAGPDWREGLSEALSAMTPFKRPRLFAELETMPRNAMGKISRTAVRDAVLSRLRLEDGARPRLIPHAEAGDDQ